MKKSPKLLLLSFCLAISSVSCDAIYGLLHKEGAEEKKLVGEVIPYEKNYKVEEIQTLLKLYGYNPGKVDGKFGARTREAIARFQRENGLEESRFVDDATWDKLNEFVDNELIIEGKVNIKRVQEILNKTGFSAGTPDGVMGPKTQEAIKIFQREHQIPMDGEIGYQTLSALSFYLSS